MMSTPAAESPASNSPTIRSQSQHWIQPAQCTSLQFLSNAPTPTVVAGCSDGTLRLLHGDGRTTVACHILAPAAGSSSATAVDDVSTDSSSTNTTAATIITTSKLHHHSKLPVQVATAGQYIFASLARGSKSCVAVEWKKEEEEGGGVSIQAIHRHADAKLRGLGAAHYHAASDSYILLTGMGIQNLHVYQFRRRAAANVSSSWKCLVDTPTNGNTIEWLSFFTVKKTPATSHSQNYCSSLQAVSKSAGQAVRVWDLDDYLTTAATTTAPPPVRPSFTTVPDTQDCVAVDDSAAYCTVSCLPHVVHSVPLPWHHSQQQHAQQQPDMCLPLSNNTTNNGSTTASYRSRSRRTVLRTIARVTAGVWCRVSDGSVWHGPSGTPVVATATHVAATAAHLAVATAQSITVYSVAPPQRRSTMTATSLQHSTTVQTKEEHQAASLRKEDRVETQSYVPVKTDKAQSSHPGAAALQEKKKREDGGADRPARITIRRGSSPRRVSYETGDHVQQQQQQLMTNKRPLTDNCNWLEPRPKKKLKKKRKSKSAAAQEVNTSQQQKQQPKEEPQAVALDRKNEKVKVTSVPHLLQPKEPSLGFHQEQVKVATTASSASRAQEQFLDHKKDTVKVPSTAASSQPRQPKAPSLSCKQEDKVNVLTSQGKITKAATAAAVVETAAVAEITPAKHAHDHHHQSPPRCSSTVDNVTCATPPRAASWHTPKQRSQQQQQQIAATKEDRLTQLLESLLHNTPPAMSAAQRRWAVAVVRTVRACVTRREGSVAAVVAAIHDQALVLQRRWELEAVCRRGEAQAHHDDDDVPISSSSSIVDQVRMILDADGI